MRAVVQRVSRAEVRVDGAAVGAVGLGLAALVSVGVDDAEPDAAYIAEKIAALRIFRDEAGLMNRSVLEAGGGVLLISQFTLHGDVRKGRRPSFIAAAPQDAAQPLFERVGALLQRAGVPTAFGSFGATMEVELVNDGPVTILLDSKRAF